MLRFCNTAPAPNLSHFLVSDPNKIWYHVRREKQFFPCRSGGAPGKLHREQTAPIVTASGLLSLGVKRCCELLHVARSAPNETKRPTYQRTKMKTFVSLFAAYVAAGAFGVAVVHNASESLQKSFTHSGTQRFVRVVR